MQLLEHFKEVTKHPKNAEKLKGLILQLAVQGKLTKQWREENPDVEPASVLLEKIKAEKKRLVKERKIKKDNTVDEIANEEIPFPIPDSWEWCRLGEYIHNFGQKNPDQEFEYIDVASIDNKRGKLKDELEVLSPNLAPSRARKIVKKGCILYSTVRPYLLNIAIIDREFSREPIASTAFAILNPMLGCSELYLYHLLRSNFFINYVESCMKGVAYPAINDANLLNGLIPIPPLAEQKAIVAIVNQLFAEVEQLENLTKERIQLKSDFVTSALNQLTQAAESQVASHWELIKSQFGTFFTEKENIQKLREAVLQLAVQGKLTHHWRSQRKLSTRLPDGQGIEVEPASVLLEKIKAEKDQLIKAGKIKKEKPLPPISKEEIPYELPEGWVWCRLGKVTNSFSTGPFGSMLHKDDYVVDGTPVINPQQMVNGKIVPSKKMQVSDTTKSRLFRYVLKEGNFIIARRGEMGRCAIVTNKEDGFLCGTGSFFLDLAFEINREFIYLLFQSEFVREYLKSSSNGATMSNLNQSIVLNMSIPLPPVEEQIVIVEKVNGLMALCDELEKEIETYQTTQEEWMQSCLREVVEK